MAVKISELCDAIGTTLSATIGLETYTPYSELTEGIAVFDCPRLEVHPNSGTCDPSGNTDRTSFNAGVQMTVIEIYADIYAARRSQLSDDMKDTVTMLDALSDVFQAQERPPFFGVAQNQLKAFSWSWKRRTFRRAKAWYMGARFTIACKVF